jgi:hypothetical protein
MIDRVTKTLLAAIALGLWLNALNPWIRPVAVQTSNAGLERSLLQISGHLIGIENATTTMQGNLHTLVNTQQFLLAHPR